MSEIAKRLEDFTRQIIEVVRGFVEKTTTAISARVDALEKRIGELPTELKGETGEPGEKGQPGETGAQGEQGPQGPAGAVGEQGAKGDAGDPGDPGAKGDHGEKGEVGAPGKDWDMAAARIIIEEAVKKSVAEIVVKDGEDGRDAIELEILSAIKDGKRYERGTWARHAGGLVRAFRDTDPITDAGLQACGWEVMVNGLQEADIVQGDDLRSFVAGFRLTDGAVVHKTFVLPVVLDRGVFKVGNDYQRGDSVSWDGSTWIAQEAVEKADQRPMPPLWRLSVKRGSDGKDAGHTPARSTEPIRLR